MQRRILKQLAIVALINSIVISAYAVAPGFYMGVMAGPATNGGGTQRAQVLGAPPGSTTPASPKSTQFGSRLLMGYKVNKYAGFEAGLTYISGINYNVNAPTCSGVNVRVRDLDVVGKGAFPIGNSFDVFGKAGVAVVYQSTSGALNPNLTQACGKTQYTNKFSPTVSVGASYDLSQSWVADASWNRIMTGGIISNVDFYALGLSYHFVDVYCGQFLC